MGDHDRSHDHCKRTTLKILGGSAIGLSVSSLAGANSISVGGSEPGHLPELKLAQSSNLKEPDVQIQLVSSEASPENTLIFKNNTAQTLAISQFLPSMVYVNARQLNVNDALKREPLVLTPGRYLSMPVELQTMSDLPAIEYIWADQAREKVGKHLSVTTLGAFMSDDKAVLFTNPALDMPA